ERPYLVVLATDGKPTVGVKKPDEIIGRIDAANGRNVRVFTFGIAENLDVPLLDRIAETTRGYSEYVAPGREIEERISSFFRKVSHPVLADLELDFGGIKVADLYPGRLPDLFRGSQVVAFGRYGDSGEVALELTGVLAGKRRSFAYDASFPAQNAANEFLPQLWARRKIGYLLDQIRLHGQSKELVDEVVRLSKEYGIATAYTSYLVLENEEAYRRHGIVREGALRSLRQKGVAAEAPAGAAASAVAARERFAAEHKALGADADAVSGGEAIRLSRRLRDWKESGAVAGGERARLHRVHGKTFAEVGGAYVDTEFTAEMETLQLKWGSDAYFAALEALPELKDFLALGESVVVVIGEKALVVADDGEDEMTPEEIKAFFGK
ncbi:MAG: trypsin, partial [Planctomycetota bacterium]